MAKNEVVAKEAAAPAASSVATIESVTAGKSGKASDFVWKADGKTMSFSEFTKGKVVFLNFWATWCPPCRREIPDIVEISKEIPADKLVIIGISLDQGANASSLVEKFAQSKSIPYLNLIGSQELTEAYGGINSIPTTFIIDRNGAIVDRIVGSQSKAQFLEKINKVL